MLADIIVTPSPSHSDSDVVVIAMETNDTGHLFLWVLLSLQAALWAATKVTNSCSGHL